MRLSADLSLRNEAVVIPGLVLADLLGLVGSQVKQKPSADRILGHVSAHYLVHVALDDGTPSLRSQKTDKDLHRMLDVGMKCKRNARSSP